MKLRVLAAALACAVLSHAPALAQTTLLPPGQQCFQATSGLNGMVGTLGTVTGGSGGTAGTYGGVALTGGSGSGATANITVSAGAVSAVTILNPGTQYVVGDVLSAAAGTIGGATGFSVPINSVTINSSLAGGTAAYYLPNTLTFKTTWKNSTQTTPNTNPVHLDQNGCAVVYGLGSYRQIVKDSLGNTVWDALTASTAALGNNPASSGAGDFMPVGTILPTSGFSAPANYVLAFGQAISRASFPDALAAFTFSATATCVSGNTTLAIAGDVNQLRLGTPVEGSCIAPGTTVAAIIGAGVIQISIAATSTVSAPVKFFPWGNGNASTTFNVPDLRGRVLSGADAMGGSAAGRLTTTYYGTLPTPPAAASLNCAGGCQTLATQNLPPYTPSGSNGTVTAAGTVSAPTITLSAAATGVVNSGTGGSANMTGGGGALLQATITATASVPAFTGSAVAGPAFTGTPQGGTTAPFSIIQPSLTVNYVVKVQNGTLPTVGVLSLGGMTGDLLCGAGLSCTGSTVSVSSLLLPAFVGDSGAGGVQGQVPAPAAGTGPSGYVLRAFGDWGLAGNGKSKGIMENTTTFLGKWNLYDAYGSAISNAGTVTGGLQEFFNACYKPDATPGIGHDCEWIGGQQDTPGGGGARIITPANSVTMGAGSGKVLRAGATSLFSTSAIGSASSLIVDSQIMGDIRLDGWQVFNFGTGNSLEFKPTTTILTGAPQLLDSRFSITTVGSVLFNSTGNQGFSAAEVNIIELNAAQDRSATVTISIASPGVVTWTGHGQAAGAKVSFSTTGALPTGLTAGTIYRIKTVLDANTFTLAAAFAGVAINTSGTQSGVQTITAKQQRPYGLAMPTPVSGANASFLGINVKHLHDIGAGADAFRWGDGAPAVNVNMSGNVFGLGISTANEAANGIHTWASGNLYVASIAGITTGKSLLLEAGAIRNIFLLPYNEASSTITDNSGVSGNANGGNIIIGDGRISIGTQLVPTIDTAIPSGHLWVSNGTTVTATDGGTISTLLDTLGSTDGQWLTRGSSTWGATQSPILGGSGVSANINMRGLTSGTVALKVQDVAGTFNFNLPITAGTSGQALVSGGGGSAAMTWADVITASSTTTFTNKTFDTAGAGNVFKINGTTVSGITGTGPTAVLQNTPTLTTPVLGVATATTINKVAFTAPATSATLTLIDGTTLTGPAASGTAMTLGNNESISGVKTFGLDKLLATAGNSASTVAPGGKLTAQVTSTGTPASTTETTLQTYSLPANALNANGRGVKVTAWGSYAANANTKNVRLYFGASLSGTGAVAQNGTKWIYEGWVYRTGSNTQTYYMRASAATTFLASDEGAAAETDSGAVVIKVTGINGTATANDIVCDGMTVEMVN